MHEQDKAILQGLVSVAWADGDFAERERELMEALIEEFGANEAEGKELREYMATKKGLEDIPLNELSAGDRRNLLSHAVALSWIDGDQAESEAKFLEQLRDHLKVTPEDFDEISKVQTARAKDLLKLLESEG